MYRITQPVAILPEASQSIIDAFSRAEAAILAAETVGKKPEAKDARPILRIDPARKLAVVDIAGTLLAKRTPCMKAYPNLFDATGCDEVFDSLMTARNDERVETVLLNIDSPGGQVKGIPEVAGAVKALREKKPVFAWTAGMCCSAAYWIAAQADAIFSTLSADVGSIGVYMAFVDTAKKLESDGYRVELFSTGKYKGAGVTGSLTDEQRAHYRERVEEIFTDFRAAIASRGIPDEAMQGQTFFGVRAAENRLVDGFALTPLQALKKFQSLKLEER